MYKKLFEDKDIIKHILSKGGVTFLFRMFAMAFSFLSMLFITNFYGEAVFGRYSLALTILQISVMIFGLGIPYAFVSFTGEYNNDENKALGLLLKSLKIALISSLIPLFFYLIFASFISETIFSKPSLYFYIIILSMGIPFLIIHEIICYFFISIKKIVKYGLFLFVVPNLLFIILLLLIFEFKLETYYTFLGYVASIAITVLIGFGLIFNKKIKIISPQISINSIIKKSFPMMMSGIFLLLLNWTDILMLGTIESDSVIGIYNVAFKIGSLTLFFAMSMNVVIMPKVSEYFYLNKFDEMKKTINRTTQLLILLTVPLALIIIFFSKLILSVFGAGFVAGSNTLILITLGALFSAMAGNVDQILNMTNNQKYVSRIFFFGFLLNVVLNLFLIPRYGIEGAATSSLITNIFINIIFVIVIKKKLGFYTFM